MAQVQPVTELDFDALKAEMIAWIKTNPTFTDYNFEGSALNAIADLLAYNTSSLAYYGNMVHNEGFLDSAQHRSSVVSKAKELGYTPHSMIGSTAYLNITVSGLAPNTTLYLPRGSIFTSNNELGSYQFVVTEDTLSTPVGTTSSFSNLKVVAGTLTSNTFIVNSIQNPTGFFKIPNKDIDTTTLQVVVRDTGSSVNTVSYTHTKEAFGIASDSKVFYLQESFDGYYQIYFGQDLVGSQPVDGNVIEISYMTVGTTPANPNGSRLFSYSGSFGTGVTSSIVTTQVAFGGQDRESIDSIKYNSRLSYTTKRRAVEASDYEFILKEQFPFIKSVAVWGGENNVPPVYGKVFVSVQPVAGLTISDTTKRETLTPFIKERNVLTVQPEFIDPEYINLDFVTSYKFAPANTTSNQSTVTGMIKTAIASYLDEISVFNKTYVESELIRTLVDLDPGIVSVFIDKSIGFNAAPLVGINTNFKTTLNNQIIPGSLYSTKFSMFTTSEMFVSLKEIPDSNGSIGVYDTSGNLIATVGSIDYSTGTIDVNLQVYRYISANRFIGIRCKAITPDVSVERNQIVYLNMSGVDTTIDLADSNQVNVTLV